LDKSTASERIAENILLNLRYRGAWYFERQNSVVRIAHAGGDISNSLIIRSVALADFAQWLPLWQGYNLFYGRPAFPEGITRITWSRFFDANEPAHAIVAEKDGQLLGLVHYLFHRSTTQIAPTCYLQDLFTNESARGKGIGRALIVAVYARAREAGCPRVYWQTHETNLTAMKLYDKVAERSGFLVYRKQV
jgi:GNAT superfamily N-acetyltransferase